MAGRRGPRGRQVRDKLTDNDVRRAGPGHHSDGKGLYLRVSPTGAKSWSFRYRIDGKLVEMGLGSADDVPLYKAREKADAIRKQLRQFRDGEIADHPLDIKHATTKARTAARQIEAAKQIAFRDCAEAYIRAHKAGWRSPRSLGQWEASLRDYVYPVLGAVPAALVDVGLVMRVLEPIWSEKPETASRVRQRIEAVLDWATARGYRQGENPARWRGHLENLLPKRSRVRRVENFTALPYSEVGTFMAELRAVSGVAARALEFAILTATRSAEAMRARWSEFDLGERVWTIPPDRMKSGKEHRVPLSDSAMALLRQMRALGDGDFVFLGSRPGQPMSHNRLWVTLDRLRPGLTVHGFRSTFAQWAADRTAYPFEVRELALAHTVGDAVVRAYQRSDLFDRRRRLMEEWARFCEGAEPAGEVVSLRTPQ